MARRIVSKWLSLVALPGLVVGCQAIKGPHANQPLLMSKQPVEGKFGDGAGPTQLASAEPKAPLLPSTAYAAGPPANLGPPTTSVLRPNDIAVAPLTPPDNVSANPQRRPTVTAVPAVRSNVRTDVPMPGSPVDRPSGTVPANPAFRSAPEAQPTLQPAPASQPMVAPSGAAVPRQPIDPLLSSAPVVAQPALAAARPQPVDPLLSSASPAAAVVQPIAPAAPQPPPAPARFDGKFGHDAGYTTLQGIVDRHHHGHVYLRYCDPRTEDQWGGKVCLDDDPRLASVKEGDVLRVEGNIVPEADTTRRHTWKHYPRYHVKNLELIQPK